MLSSLCSDIGVLYWTIRLAGLLGIILLAIPVLAVDMKYRRAAGFSDDAPQEIPPGFENIVKDTARMLWEKAGHWSRTHSTLLWLGYALLLSSSVAALVADAVCPAA